MSVITPVNGSGGGGGGGGSVSAEPTFITKDDFYFLRTEHTLNPGFSGSTGNITVSAGSVLYIHEIEFNTPSAEFGRLDSFIIDGKVFTIRLFGSRKLNFVELTGSPLKVATDIQTQTYNSSSNTIAILNQVIYFGRLVTTA